MFRAMIDVATESMIVRDAAGRIVAWNQAATDLYGFARDQAIGWRADDLLQSVPRVEVAERQAPGFWTALITRQTVKRKTVQVEARLSALYEADGSLGYILEASSQVIGDGAEARGREQYRAMFQHMPIALCSVNSDALTPYYASLGINDRIDMDRLLLEQPAILQRVGELCYFEELNARCVELLGATHQDQLVGKPVAFAFALRPDTYRKIVVAGIHGTKAEQETQLVGIDGRVRDVLLACIRYQDGRSRSTLTGIMDIGARLKAEADFHRVSAQFERASRVSFLGEAFSMIAHEMSQPISAVAAGSQSGLHWLEQDPPDFAAARLCFSRNLSHAMRARDVIGRVRDMAEAGAPVLVETSLSELVADATLIVAGRSRAQRIRIVITDNTSPHKVEVDKARLEQVVVNILSNAIEMIEVARPQRRLIEVILDDMDSTVCCSIRDSGPGFQPDRLAGVFDRNLVRNKSEQSLGLPLCRAIVEHHDGRIFASNDSPLGGASVRFELPASFHSRKRALVDQIE
nr:ATP-binding protein [Sphingomonas kyeonggiensis]